MLVDFMAVLITMGPDKELKGGGVLLSAGHPPWEFIFMKPSLTVNRACFRTMPPPQHLEQECKGSRSALRCWVLLGHEGQWRGREN